MIIPRKDYNILILNLINLKIIEDRITQIIKMYLHFIIAYATMLKEGSIT